MINTMINMMKSIFAIHAAVPAIPANPKIAATIAIMKNKIDHPNIVSPFVLFI
jgi:hypothetical protein